MLPVKTGKEIAWVQHPNKVCCGSIGIEGKVCLLPAAECTVATHDLKVRGLPKEPFLIKLKGINKGLGSIVLPADTLEESLIDNLLESENLDWVQELKEIKPTSAQSLEDRKHNKSLLDTVKKHLTFTTPSKLNRATDFHEQLKEMHEVVIVVEDLLNQQVDLQGNRIPFSLKFDEVSYSTLATNVLEKLDAVCEFILSSHKITSKQPEFLCSYIQPLETLVEGIRLQVIKLKASLGDRNPEEIGLPTAVWEALHQLGNAVKQLDEVILAVTKDMTEHKEIMDFLLLQFGDMEPNSSSYDVDRETKLVTLPKAEANPVEFVTNLSRSYIRDGILKHESKPQQQPTVQLKSAAQPPGAPGGNPGASCNTNAQLCNKCMARMDLIDNTIIKLATRVGALEEVREGKVEATVLVKDQIFRGRTDVSAWVDLHFPVNLGMSAEGGCFMTPHYLLNLVTADMAGRTYPKIPLDKKDFKRPDATAYYALQADKPDFMTNSTPCPSHLYKATKSEKEKATITFIPSYADFGRGSDLQTLHYRFKTLVDHIAKKQQIYVESRLGSHPKREVLDIAQQLLVDSISFVREMLDFMEELFSACNDSFDAPTEAWHLVCHCLDELFTKEFKPSLQYCVSQDLVDTRETLIGVLHSAFSLNMKVRELVSTRLKNHHSTTTLHVRFVMKMAKSNKSSSDKLEPITDKMSKFKLENKDLKKQLEDAKKSVIHLESRLDKHIASFNKEKKAWNKEKPEK